MRAKFSCWKVFNESHGENKYQETVELGAVTSSSEENSKFWKATPSAHLQMTVTNPDAYGFFVPNKEYYLDFSEAPK